MLSSRGTQGQLAFWWLSELLSKPLSQASGRAWSPRAFAPILLRPQTQPGLGVGEASKGNWAWESQVAQW